METEVEVKPEAVEPNKPDDGKNDGTNDGNDGNNTGENDGDATIPSDMNNTNNSENGESGEGTSEEIVEGNKEPTSKGGYRTSPNTGLLVNGTPYMIGGGILCIVAALLFVMIRKKKE